VDCCGCFSALSVAHVARPGSVFASASDAITLAGLLINATTIT
jgi:hypothetical protein